MKSFASIDGFIAHLGRVAAQSDQIQARAMRDAASVLQSAAKASLGSYQDSAGPFGAWPDLSERTQAERAEFGYSTNEPLLRTGELRDHIDISFDGHHSYVGVPDETVGDGSKADPVRNIGDVAADLEMGTGGKYPIPPRSFLGRAGFTKGHVAAAVAAKVFTDAVAGLPYRAVKASEAEEVPF